MFGGCYGVVRCLAVKFMAGKDGKAAKCAPTDPPRPRAAPAMVV